MRSCKDKAEPRAKFWRGALLIVWVGILQLAPVGSAEQPTAVKRVLVIYWYNKDFPANVLFDQSFQAAIKRASADGNVEYYSEYLETNRFPAEKQALLLHDYLREKYAGVQIDVIVSSGYVTHDFLLKYRATLFPNTPIIFLGVERPTATQLASGPGVTGVVLYESYKPTLDLALTLHPQTEQVFIISGTLEHDKKFEKIAREHLTDYDSKVPINYLSDLSREDLISQVMSLPERSIVLYVWQQIQNGQDKVLESAEVLGLIARASRVPVYGLSEGNLGNGLVGGYVFTMEANANKVAEIALKLAHGGRAQDIPVQRAPVVPMFDWRELKRWGIREDRLPAGSVVRFKELPFLDMYRWRIVAILVILGVQTLLITFLLIERTRRQRATKRLRSSEERFSKTFRANPQPMSLTTLEEGRYLDVNDSFVAMSGYQREEVLQRTSLELNIWPSPADRAAFVNLFTTQGYVKNVETQFRTKDGFFRVLLSSAEMLDIGKKKCILIASSDITDRKESEYWLAELTGRLLRAQDEERRHIARELHDVTAQNIGLILLNLAQVQNAAAALDKRSKERLTESVALGEQSLKEIRTLSYVLHPPLLDQAGLVTALQWYVRGFIERSGVKVTFSEAGNNGHRMPPEVEYALFRVVQECLTNIRRHTTSETAEISLTRTPEQVLLSVRDQAQRRQVEVARNGDGVESIGVGIPGMRHRLKQLGGDLVVDSYTNGTTVTATVPVKWVDNDSNSISR